MANVICVHHVTDGDEPCGHTEEVHGTDQEVDLDGRPTSPEYLVCFSCLEEERSYWSHDFDPERIHFEVVSDNLTPADYAKGAMDGIATVIASDIGLRTKGRDTSLPTEELHDLFPAAYNRGYENGYAALQERLEAAEAGRIAARTVMLTADRLCQEQRARAEAAERLNGELVEALGQADALAEEDGYGSKDVPRAGWRALLARIESASPLVGYCTGCGRDASAHDDTGHCAGYESAKGVE